MLYRIRHATRFSYDQSAYQSQNEIRMRPSDGPLQRCVEFALEVSPAGADLEYDDYYGNRVHAVSIHAPHNELQIVARSLVERQPEGEWRPAPLPFEKFLLGDPERNQSEFDFLNPSPYIRFSHRLKKFFWMNRPRPGEGVADYALRMVTFVRDQFAYEPGITRVQSTAEEILKVGAGVCQDFAHLTIGILRLSGIPARYVSGYLAPLPNAPDETPLGSQASHAWLEALLPGAAQSASGKSDRDAVSLEWVGFDPTHGCRLDIRHLRVAVGRDYSDVPPLRGSYRSRGSNQTMSVDLKVETAPGPQASNDRSGGCSQQ